MQSITDDDNDEASVDKADKSSISSYYGDNSRRRHVIILQTLPTKQQRNETADITSMNVI